MSCYQLIITITISEKQKVLIGKKLLIAILKILQLQFRKNIHRIASVSPDISHKENSLNRIGYLVTNNTFRKRQPIK